MRKLRLVAAATLLSVACIGPSGSHREGYQGPAGPTTVDYTNLYGRVIDIQTGGAIADAKVDIGSNAVITDAAGNYNLPGLRATMVQIVVSSENYDTLRTQLALRRGDHQFTLRIRSIPPPSFVMEQSR